MESNDNSLVTVFNSSQTSDILGRLSGLLFQQRLIKSESLDEGHPTNDGQPFLAV
jgi:hypothetical protein